MTTVSSYPQESMVISHPSSPAPHQHHHQKLHHNNSYYYPNPVSLSKSSMATTTTSTAPTKKKKSTNNCSSVSSITLVNNGNQSTNGIKKKKRKTKKNKIIIPMRDMIRLFSMPQQVAARKLNVSISTLKRRFYELDLPKWPANHTLQEFCLGEMNSEAVKCTYHSSSSSNNNNSSNTRSNSPVNSGMSTTNHNTLSSSDNSLHLKQNASYYSLYKEPTDEEKKSLGTVLNMYDTMDEKYIDPMTMTILKEAFLENTEAANNRDGCGNSTSSDSEEEATPPKK